MIKQIPLSLFHLQDLIFKDRKGRQDSRENWGWITLDGQEDSMHWISILDQISYVLLKHWQNIS